MVKSFVSNMTYDLSYNLNKYIQYKYVWKLFKVGCLHQHNVIAMYHLDRNEKMLEVFAYPNNNRAFYRLELNL